MYYLFSDIIVGKKKNVSSSREIFQPIGYPSSSLVLDASPQSIIKLAISSNTNASVSNTGDAILETVDFGENLIELGDPDVNPGNMFLVAVADNYLEQVQVVEDTNKYTPTQAIDGVMENESQVEAEAKSKKT